MSPRVGPSGPSKPAWRPQLRGARAHDLADLDTPGAVRLVLAAAAARRWRGLPDGPLADRRDGGAGPAGWSRCSDAAGEGGDHHPALRLHHARDRALVGGVPRSPLPQWSRPGGAARHTDL